MNKIKLALATLAAVAAIGCSSEEPYVPAPKDDPKSETNKNESNKKDDVKPATNPYTKLSLTKGEAEVANAGYGFAWNLFDRVNAETKGKNVFMSPTSVNIALTMLLNGASGDTRNEIVNALGLEDMSMEEINENSKFLVSTLLDRDKDCQLLISNSLWVDETMPVKAGYKATLADYFNATAQNTNAKTFAADVNAWSDRATNGLVPQIVAASEYYDLALLNSIYFQNVWKFGVSFKDAGKKEFRNFNGSKKLMPYMETKIGCHFHGTKCGSHVHVAFGNGAYLMSITLPNEGVSIDECIDELKDSEMFLDENERIVKITMPKFEIKGQMELVQALKSLGIEKAFDYKTAEFPYISDIETFVATVKQGYSFKVDDKGATAAATTFDGTIAGASMQMEYKMFVDRPFIFTIYEQSTGCILFMGKIERF